MGNLGDYVEAICANAGGGSENRIPLLFHVFDISGAMCYFAFRND